METEKAAAQDLGSHGHETVDLISLEDDHHCWLRARFTDDRLRQLVRKLDYHVLPQLVIVYLLAYINRSNVDRAWKLKMVISVLILRVIGNARLFGELEDLHVSGQQWNAALSVFSRTYAVGGVYASASDVAD
ncbi:hypothetical protein BDV12DRAFT_195518 [Aspergillus spectabilis]